MKKLTTLALFGICAISMFSCKPDKSYEVGFGDKYYIQIDSIIDGDTIPYYSPYFTITSNRMISSFNLSSRLYNVVTDSYDTTYYPLQWLSTTNTGVYTYYSSFISNQYPRLTYDEVTAGPFYLSATNSDGEVYTNQGSINGLKVDTMGPVNVTQLRYYTAQHLTMQFYEVKGASYYVFSVSQKEAPQFRTLLSAGSTSSTSDGKLEVGSNIFNQYNDGTELIIRLAAYNGGRIIKESKDFKITIGTDQVSN